MYHVKGMCTNKLKFNLKKGHIKVQKHYHGVGIVTSN